jgi:hypothetical protein
MPGVKRLLDVREWNIDTMEIISVDRELQQQYDSQSS